MKVRVVEMRVFVVFLFLVLLSGCLFQGEKMSLLDEVIVKIEVSLSNGVDNVNEDILFTMDDRESINSLERIIRNSFESKVEVDGPPDFDLVVSYGDQFPVHGIHIWLGGSGEPSLLTYIFGDGGTYTTSREATKQLRKLLIKEQ